eukprot:CAMPEP_0201629344 /NCGR_PEP_ID=MMETSP0493-20130528/4049_1 /ASSEMBLY_ACC=CAM_ASM_000838 /TAXON_ID=420259 /ORGANISM="Thalassiosira gravida, Strain GMp14c1" /LENGTH=80 /DNA_ID=CAMNT_0048100331 /DNA_START=482 /DNA_END=721 /DNA_ORIENTATION=+
MTTKPSHFSSRARFSNTTHRHGDAVGMKLLHCILEARRWTGLPSKEAVFSGYPNMVVSWPVSCLIWRITTWENMRERECD